ncbi:MAG: hypothetical protein AAGC81_02390 [Pseudomonadota bacterium]
MNILEKFGTDDDLETGTGVTLDFGSGCTVTVHRAGGSNKRYHKALAKALKPYRQQVQADNLDMNEAIEAFAEVYVETVIIAWTGVEDNDGPVDIKDKKRSVALLVAAPDFFEIIKTEAEARATFQDEEKTADAGN